MATVTGLTAERMVELANGFLVSGSVNESGDLILANGAGTQINAGHVKGDTVAKLIDPKPLTDAPSTYMFGISIFSISDTTTYGAWPVSLGVVETVRNSANRTVQRMAEKTTGRTFVRTEGSSTDQWGAWQEMAILSKVAPLVHTHAATDINSGILNNAQLEGTVTRGRGTVTSVTDWNTLTSSGIYEVNTLGTNTPSGAYGWGVLVVSVGVTASTGTTSQVYYPHQSDRSIWQRVRYGGSSTNWSPWSEHRNWSDNQADIKAALVDTGTTSWLPTRLQATAQLLSSGTNIQSVKNTGFYRGTTITNAPSTDWWWYEVIRHDDSYVNYMAYEYHGDRIFRAYYNAGVWSGWDEVLHDTDTGWVDINTGLSWGTGWSYSADTAAHGGLKARKKNGLVQISLANVRLAANTLASSAIPGDGNVTNIKVFSNLQSQFRPPAGTIGTFSVGTSGPLVAMYVDETGTVTIGATAPGFNVTIANSISGQTTFLA